MSDLNDLLEVVNRTEVEVPCKFLCGSAGTGKTFTVLGRANADPKWGLVCATTGIAATNLGTTTLNAVLKYFDTNSLQDAYLSGRLTRTLHQLVKLYEWLVIDEVSMMDAKQLDLIHQGLIEANGFEDVKRSMGIFLCGDFAQLPPVKAKWAFEAECWPKFAVGTERLTKIWRQAGGEFIAALNAARAGDGGTTADIMTSAGVKWHSALDTNFDGTCIVPRNDEVDRYNWISLSRVQGKKIQVTSERWGRQSGDWKNIPERLDVKVGAYVMLLANKMNGPSSFEYCNGDTGHVMDLTPQGFVIKLVRNGKEIEVDRVTRSVTQKDAPDEMLIKAEPKVRKDGKLWIMGEIKYHPIRLAYATTIHKSQGLSLDRIQYDFRGGFAGGPAMAYVALSRCRTMEGLRLVGTPDMFVKRCAVDPRVRAYL